MEAGTYVVKTVKPHYSIKGKFVHCGVLELQLTYDEQGKQHWSCKNQKPIQFLKDGI